MPQSDAIIAAAAPVRAVIELNGGTAARLGIKPGDRVLGGSLESTAQLPAAEPPQGTAQVDDINIRHLVPKWLSALWRLLVQH